MLLNNYKGKLIILDFWASWCSSCLQQFPKLDSLQVRFKDAVQILLVNPNIKGDTQAKMQGRLKGYGLTSITFNDSLKKLFPYEFIPHYVWLDGEGKLLAITTANMVNEATIKGYLKTTIN
ncbi:MAG: TlpA family protein disulfide reductase [Sphingobacteriales bacterium]|nr:MAG: TlpA family protein disulfide reductase [Sphingobacteriales bacterium]